MLSVTNFRMLTSGMSRSRQTAAQHFAHGSDKMQRTLVAHGVPRLGVHFGAETRHQDALARAREDGPDVDPGAPLLAPERAPLRRAAGAEKAEMAAKFGDEQVLLWRRSYDVPPPPLEPGDPRHP